MSIQCPKCGLGFSEGEIGKSGKCPNCGEQLQEPRENNPPHPFTIVVFILLCIPFCLIAILGMNVGDHPSRKAPLNTTFGSALVCVVISSAWLGLRFGKTPKRQALYGVTITVLVLFMYFVTFFVGCALTLRLK
jgi:quinol-cytochrome oxidoreductase complex cytochrome b subunit